MAPRTQRKPATKRASDMAVAFVPDIMPEPVKKPRNKSLICLRCTASSADVDWAMHDGEEECGEACQRCWLPFRAEYQRDGTWPEVANKCSEEEEHNQGYERSAAVLAGDLPLPFDPQEVQMNEDFDLEITRSFVGIPRGDFETASGKTLAEAGLTEQDCANELRGSFKGVIVANPLRPFVEYNVTARVGVQKSSKLLPESRNCRPGQAERVAADARSTREKDAFFTKLRNCGTTLNGISAKLNVPDLVANLFPGLANSSAASSSSDSAGKNPPPPPRSSPLTQSPGRSLAPSPAKEGGRPATGAFTSPAAKRHCGPDAQSRSGGGLIGANLVRGASFSAFVPSDAQSIVSTIAGPASKRSDAGTALARPAKQRVKEGTPGQSLEELCEYHISQVSLEALLSNKTQGHGLRWATAFANNYVDDPSPAVRALEVHLEEARAAGALATLDIPKATWDEVSEHMKKLDNWGDAMPTTMKHQVLDKTLDRYFLNNQFDAYLRAACPWITVEDDKRSFSPKGPLIVCIEGQPKDHASAFQAKVLRLFSGLVRRGKEGSGALLEACRSVRRFLEESAIEVDSDEEQQEDEEGDGNNPYDPQVEFANKTAKALELLIRADDPSIGATQLASAGDLNTLLGVKELGAKAAAASPWLLLSSDLSKNTDVYREKIQAWTKYGDAMKKHIPAMARATQKLTSLGSVTSDSGIPVEYANEMLPLYLQVSAELPDGMVSGFETKLVGTLESVITDAFAAIQIGHAPALASTEVTKDPLKVAAALKALLNMIKEKFSPMATSVKAHLDKISQIQANSLKAKVVDDVKAVLEEATDNNGCVIVGKLDSLQTLVDDVNQKLDSPQESLGHIAAEVDDVIHALLNGAASCDGHMAQLVELSESLATFLPKDSEAQYKQRIACLSAVDALLAKQDGWAKLGQTPQARCDADKEFAVVKGYCVQLRLAIKAHGNCNEKERASMTTVQNILKKCEAEVGTAGDLILQALALKAKGMHTTIQDSLKEAKWPCTEPYKDADWDTFQTGAEKTWMTYKGGDNARSLGLELKSVRDKYGEAHGVFFPDSSLDDDPLGVDSALDQVESLAFAVKTLRAMQKNEDQEVKAKKYAKSKLVALEKPENAASKTYLPPAMLRQLQMLRDAA